jgi:hypothetical protein
MGWWGRNEDDGKGKQAMLWEKDWKERAGGVVRALAGLVGQAWYRLS